MNSDSLSVDDLNGTAVPDDLCVYMSRVLEICLKCGAHYQKTSACMCMTGAEVG